MDRASAHVARPRPAGREPAKPREPDPAIALNPAWQGLATSRTTTSGPRLSRPDDALEREADALADRAVGSGAASGWMQLTSTKPMIQRACQACREQGQVEEPEIQRQASGSTLTHAGPTIGAALSRRAGQGRPLDARLRASFEPRLGADLSQVRTHTDAEAQRSARALQARAFTWGRDIYFGPGAWAPESASGRRLLAHELAHVIQQREGRVAAIQREPEFRIVDEERERSSSDADRVFFDLDSAAIAASQETPLTDLIARLRARAPAEIFLTGMASEEGRAGHNRVLANQRMAAVEQRLRAAGFTRITRRPIELAASQGQIEYRRQRFVQVDTTQAAAGAECSVANLPATRTRDQTSCESAFASAWPRAVTTCQGALDAMRTGSHAAERTNLGVDAGTAAQGDRQIVDMIQRVQAVVGRMGPATTDLNAGQGHVCHDRCDTSCSTIASGGPNGISLCRPFYDSIAVDVRPWALIHEAAHGTGEFTDIQYQHQRGFEGLTADQRQFNADSITRVIVELGDPTTGGHRRTWEGRLRAPGLVQPSGVSLTSALGAVQMALVLSAFDQTFYYEYIREAQAAGAWPCVEDTANAGNRRGAARAIAGRFEMRGAPTGALDHACARPVRPPPGSGDHVRLAAIVERLERMRGVVTSDLEVSELAGLGGPSWRQTGGRWFVDVPPGYSSSRSSEVAAQELLRALVMALPNVERRFVADFVEIAFAAARSRGSRNLSQMQTARSSRRAADATWGTPAP